MNIDLLAQWKTTSIQGSPYNPFLFFLLFSGFIAVLTDIRFGKIFNLLTFPGMLLGVALVLVLVGPSWLGASFLGVGVAFLAFGLLYFFKIMGAGDVKYLMALGAWSGPKYVIETALLSIFLAAGIGLVVLTLRGQLFSFVKKLTRFVLSIFMKELALEVPRFGDVNTLPMAIPIVCAAWLNYYTSPIQQLLWGQG
jgi:prepilin peptidase CpaA